MKPAVIVALGTGMRMREQLRMKRHQVDFLRNIVTARNTKNGRPRDIPMNDDVTDALAELCKNKRSDDYVFVNPKTKSCLQETKTAFHTACRLAGIEGLTGRICGQHSELDWPKRVATRSRSHNFSDTQMFG